MDKLRDLIFPNPMVYSLAKGMSNVMEPTVADIIKPFNAGQRFAPIWHLAEDLG